MKHKHMVSWEKLNKPKQVGGLGLRKLTTMNKVCLAKLGWNLYKDDRELWCKVLDDKYTSNNLIVIVGNKKAQESSLWKILVKIWTAYENKIMWTIGNGENKYARNDFRVAPGITLKDHMHNTINDV